MTHNDMYSGLDAPVKGIRGSLSGPVATAAQRFLLAAALLVTVLSAGASAETYKWTDAGGNCHFTDNLASIPKSARGAVTVDADITLADPDVRQEVEEGMRTAAILERETARRNRESRQRAAVEESRRIREEQREEARKVPVRSVTRSAWPSGSRRFT